MNKVSYGSVIVGKTVQRLLHHIVAAESYYEWPTGKLDAAMVDTKNAETISTWKGGAFPECFAKILAFIRVNRVLAKKHSLFPTIQKTVVLVNPIEAVRWPSFNGMR